MRKLVLATRVSLDYGGGRNEPGTRMPKLFSYGTLQQEDVQLATFGRRLAGVSDALVGYRQSMVAIDDPEVVRTSGADQAIPGHNRLVLRCVLFSRAQLASIPAGGGRGHERQRRLAACARLVNMRFQAG